MFEAISARDPLSRPASPTSTCRRCPKLAERAGRHADDRPLRGDQRDRARSPPSAVAPVLDPSQRAAEPARRAPPGLADVPGHGDRRLGRRRRIDLLGVETLRLAFIAVYLATGATAAAITATAEHGPRRPGHHLRGRLGPEPRAHPSPPQARPRAPPARTDRSSAETVDQPADAVVAVRRSGEPGRPGGSASAPSTGAPGRSTISTRASRRL